jgi:hypothetical protein
MLLAVGPLELLQFCLNVHLPSFYKASSRSSSWPFVLFDLGDTLVELLFGAGLLVPLELGLLNELCGDRILSGQSGVLELVMHRLKLKALFFRTSLLLLFNAIILK